MGTPTCDLAGTRYRQPSTDSVHLRQEISPKSERTARNQGEHHHPCPSEVDLGISGYLYKSADFGRRERIEGAQGVYSHEEGHYSPFFARKAFH